MVSKKIIFLVFIAIILMAGIVSAVNSVKVNWDGNRFEWPDWAYSSDDNPENAYDVLNPSTYIICDEGSSYSDNVGAYGYYVNLKQSSTYYGYWVKARCMGASHNVGRHFEHDFHSGYGSYSAVEPKNYATVYCSDNDGDGQVPSSSNNVCKQVYTTDCNDNDVEIKVGGVGSCNCNAAGKKTLYLSDVDADGFGSMARGGGIEACSLPAGYSSNSQDCDDNDVNNFPDNTEIPDGKDNNCDGAIDEGFACSPPGSTLSCGTNVGECNVGTQTCAGGQWGNCAGTYVASATEICTDNKDNNCNGLKDCADSACAGLQGPAGQICEPLGETLCSDGKDNDNDGLKDYAEDDSFCVGAYWASDSLGKNPMVTISPQIGDKIYLVLAEHNLTGTEIFEIYEDDGGNGSDDLILTSTAPLNIYGNQISTQKNVIFNWTITQTDINKAIDNSGETYPLKFYFKTKNKVSECRGPGIHIFSNLLFNFHFDQDCQLLSTENSCNYYFPACNWMNYQSSILALDWQAVVSQPSTASCSDGIQNQNETGVDCGGVCSACAGPVIDCSQYVLCSDANTEIKCGEANSCNIGPQNVDCADSNVECGCSWSSSTNLCNSYSSSLDPTTGNIVGTCAFQENEITSCENSDYYEYSTTATWSGAGTAEAAGCIGGTIGPITCSAKTKLPLESKYGILLTILAIMGIYFLFYRKKLKKY